MASDPYFSSVKLLLHCDGTDNSTTFTDSEITPKTVTASGNAHIHTGEKKFGTASAAFDGTGDYLSLASSSDFAFGTGAFTIELWAYLSSLSTVNTLFDFRPAGTTQGSYPWMNVQTNGSIYIAVRYGLSGQVLIGSSSGSISSNQWHHIAYARSGTVGTIYVDGSSVASGTDATDYAQSICSIAHSNYTGTPEELNGYMDDIRITKGVARYTATFTPAAAAFPNYQYELSGTVTESLTPTDWIVRASRLDTGAFIADLAVDTNSSGAFTLGQSTYGGPVMLTTYPKIGARWAADTVTAVGDYTFPTNCATTPYFFKATARAGDYKTGPTEPTWDTTTGNTTTDDQVTWTCQGPLIQPITQAPLIPA